MLLAHLGFFSDQTIYAVRYLCCKLFHCISCIPEAAVFPISLAEQLLTGIAEHVP